ncbi:MAG: P-type conjugative transfer ATPase TrbB [Cetobacterium sp.]
MTEQKIEYNKRILNILGFSFGKDIQNLLQDDDIIEIMLNPDCKLWIDTLSGGLKPTDLTIDPNTAMRIINTVATHIKSFIDEKNSGLTAELPETGFRFEARVPPTVKNPSFTIRKKSSLVFSLRDYVQMNCLKEEDLKILERSILEKRNILIVGGTSTGKTTFANACIASICKQERLVILEDTQELQSMCPNTVFFKTSDYTPMTSLLKSTMRYRPDRIIVGEIRGEEALDLLSAWNSGHPGGISTIHSDSAIGGLRQLEQYVERVSINKQQELIGKAVDLIVVLKREKGLRKVVSITEVLDFDNGYILKEL